MYHALFVERGTRAARRAYSALQHKGKSNKMTHHWVHPAIGTSGKPVQKMHFSTQAPQDE